MYAPEESLLIYTSFSKICVYEGLLVCQIHKSSVYANFFIFLEVKLCSKRKKLAVATPFHLISDFWPVRNDVWVYHAVKMSVIYTRFRSLGVYSLLFPQVIHPKHRFPAFFTFSEMKMVYISVKANETYTIHFTIACSDPGSGLYPL